MNLRISATYAVFIPEKESESDSFKWVTTASSASSLHLLCHTSTLLLLPTTWNSLEVGIHSHVVHPVYLVVMVHMVHPLHLVYLVHPVYLVNLVYPLFGATSFSSDCDKFFCRVSLWWTWTWWVEHQPLVISSSNQDNGHDDYHPHDHDDDDHRHNDDHYNHYDHHDQEQLGKLSSAVWVGRTTPSLQSFR